MFSLSPVQFRDSAIEGRGDAARYSDGAGRIQCLRPIAPGEEVTIFYGWVTLNEPARDPCRCGSPACLGYINFDLTDDDARHCEADNEHGRTFRERFQTYADYLGARLELQVDAGDSSANLDFIQIN